VDAAPLVKALIAAFMLLENSRDDEVDPGVAVRGMENMTFELQQWDEVDRAEFVDILMRIAEAEENAPAANFIRSMPEMLGMDA
jgi:hypothetical protein